MDMLRYFVWFFLFVSLVGVVSARTKSPLKDDDLTPKNKAAECVFGKEIRELGSKWIPDLGQPIGILYCMRCECVPRQVHRSSLSQSPKGIIYRNSSLTHGTARFWKLFFLCCTVALGLIVSLIVLKVPVIVRGNVSQKNHTTHTLLMVLLKT